MNEAEFWSMFFTLFDTFTSNWLDKLNEPTVESLSSHNTVGMPKSLYISFTLSLTDEKNYAVAFVTISIWQKIRLLI